MPTELLTIGPITSITQNVIYALPARSVIMFSDATGPTFFQSNTAAFTASIAVTLVNGQATLAGGFIRCTSATPGNITLKAA